MRFGRKFTGDSFKLGSRGGEVESDSQIVGITDKKSSGGSKFIVGDKEDETQSFLGKFYYFLLFDVYNNGVNHIVEQHHSNTSNTQPGKQNSIERLNSSLSSGNTRNILIFDDKENQK